MARLRLRLRFNPGRDGAPLDRLGEFATQVEKFLRAFAADLGVEAKKGEWIATSFTNESVAYDVVFAEPVADDVAKAGNDLIDQLAGPDAIGACSKGAFSYGTLSEFSKIGKGMAPDEVFVVGVYEDKSANEPRWHKVAYRTTAEIRQFLEAPYIAYGSVQGAFYGWVPGGSPPFFHVKPMDAGALVKCICTPAQYKLVHASTGEPNTLLNIYGDIEFDRGDNTITQVIVANIEQIRTLTADEFERLNGAIPEATGALSTEEYIAAMRDDDSHDR